jgi:hypothetical protein
MIWNVVKNIKKLCIVVHTYIHAPKHSVICTTKSGHSEANFKSTLYSYIIIIISIHKTERETTNTTTALNYQMRTSIY